MVVCLQRGADLHIAGESLTEETELPTKHGIL